MTTQKWGGGLGLDLFSASGGWPLPSSLPPPRTPQSKNLHGDVGDDGVGIWGEVKD